MVYFWNEILVSFSVEKNKLLGTLKKELQKIDITEKKA